MLFHFLFIAFFLGVGHTCPTDLQVEPCRCEEYDRSYKGPTKGLKISCNYTDVDQVRAVLNNVVETKRPVRLKLENVKLESLTSHFLVGLYLEEFVAEHCNVSAVDEYAFSAGTDTLRKISLSHNNLERVPTSSLNKLGALSKLYLSYNSIEVLHADSFKGIRSLSDLSLEGNRLKFIDSSAFENGSEFHTINLRFNELTSFPSRALSNLGFIMILHLQNNKISSLQPKDFSFVGGASLRILILSGNRIRHIPPKTFSSLKNLEYLYLSGNAIQSIHNLSFEGIEDTLHTLRLGKNLLNEVPAASLRKMRRLNSLVLGSNNISKIREDDFVPYGKSLEYLHLMNNSLASVDPKSLVSLNSLQLLDLSDNKLTMFPEETYAPVLDTLNYFYISGNPLHCDCEAVWLKGLNISAGLTKCASPEELANVDLRTIPKNSLVCKNSTAKPPSLACDAGSAEMYSASNSLSVTSNDHMVTLSIGLTYFQRCFGDNEAVPSDCQSRRNPIVGGFIDLQHCGPRKLCLTIRKDSNSIP